MVRKGTGGSKKNFQSHNFPLLFLLRQKSGICMGGVSDGVSSDQKEDGAAQKNPNYLISLSGEKPGKTILTKEGKFRALQMSAEWE